MAEISRESIEKGLAKAAISLTEEQLTRVTAYLEAFNTWNAVHNLTSIKSAREQVAALLAPSLAMKKWTDHYQNLLDLGSGGGFPGLVLALLAPEQNWVLVERSQKKANFLRYCKQEFGMENTTICEEDFTRLSVDQKVDGVVSRGSGKLQQQLQWTKAWRAQGSVLLSIQSEHSLEESGFTAWRDNHNLGLPGKESTLCLLIVT